MNKTGSNNKYDLQGIDAICAYVRQSPATLTNWKRDYKFPMKKNKETIYVSSKKDIDEYFKTRGCTAETSTQEMLHNFWEKLQYESGTKFFNYDLRSLDEISKFIGKSIVSVMDLLNYNECPIRKEKDGTYSVDADRLYFWMKDIGIRYKITYLKGMKRG